MTLIIYDKDGKVWLQMSGSYVVPNGIPYLEVEIPTGQLIKSVDVSVIPNVPIYEAFPISPMETLQDRIDYIEGTINELLGV